MKINLHMHSNCSDGALSTHQLIKEMQKCKYDCIALTDHDTVSGNASARKLCSSTNMKFIPGVEITSYLDEAIGLYDDSYKVHILGLNIDSKKIDIALRETERRKILYHKQILLNYLSTATLNASNVEIENRVSCATLLYSKNIFKSMEAAMSIFRVSPYAMSISDTVDVIHDAGGIAIWAHPFILPKNGDFKIHPKEVERIFTYMHQCNMDGMEGFYLQFSEDEQNFILDICNQNNVFCSTGTDFHADYPFEYDLLNITGRYDKKLINALF